MEKRNYGEELKMLINEKKEQSWIEGTKKMQELLVEIAKNGGASEISLEDLRYALQRCTRKQVERVIGAKFDRRSFLTAIFDDAKNKEDKKQWMKAITIMKLTKEERKEIIENSSVRQINEVIIRGLNEEADCRPNEEIMKWYSMLLEKELTYDQEADILNRLAFYYMDSRNDGCVNREIADKKVEAYLAAMECRGVPITNPFKRKIKPEKLLLGRPEHGWSKLSIPGASGNFCISYLSDVPMEWLDAAIEGLERHREFIVCGYLEPKKLKCIVNKENMYLMIEDDIFDAGSEIIVAEIVRYGMPDFCKALHESIRHNLRDWVNWSNNYQDENREAEMVEKLERLQALITEDENVCDPYL